MRICRNFTRSLMQARRANREHREMTEEELSKDELAKIEARLDATSGPRRVRFRNS
jgi:hypothetical protein